MRVIGLTGGVGSGKSVVARRLQEMLGAQLLIADEIAHVIMEPGMESYKAVVEAFGRGVLAEDGSIDRTKLAAVLFSTLQEGGGAPAADSENEKLEKMNQIVHPGVRAYIAEYIAAREGGSGFIILESAILYETGCDAFCDEVWYVAVREPVRIARLMEGRGYTREKCRAIMREQKGDGFYRSRAGRIIENNGSVEELEGELQKACLQIQTGQFA